MLSLRAVLWLPRAPLGFVAALLRLRSSGSSCPCPLPTVVRGGNAPSGSHGGTSPRLRAGRLMMSRWAAASESLVGLHLPA